MDGSMFYEWIDPSHMFLFNGLNFHCEPCHSLPGIDSGFVKEDSDLHNWPNYGNTAPLSTVKLATLDARIEEVGSVFYESSNEEQFHGAQRTPFIPFLNYLEDNAITARRAPTEREMEPQNSSGNDSVYGGSEVRSSQPASVFPESPYLTRVSGITRKSRASAIPRKKLAPLHGCDLCGRKYVRQESLRRHIGVKHPTSIEATKRTPKRTPKQASPPPANNHPSAKGPVKPTSLDIQAAANHTEPLPTTLRDTKTAQSSSTWSSLKGSNPSNALLYETLNVRVSNDCLVTPDLSEVLESCLSDMPTLSTQGFRIPVDLQIHGITTKFYIDVYKPETWALHTNSNTTQSSLGEVTNSVNTQSTALSPKSSEGAARQVEPLERQNNTADIPSLLAKLAPRSIEDELKHVNSVKDVSTDELREYGAKCGEKRKNPDDDAWLYFEGLTDASDEGEDDSNCECENITSWDNFQGDALPSFLPYICSHEIDTSSPCGDSPESGSSTSGTTSQNTPASYMSPGSRGNGLDGNARSPLGAGTGSPNNGNNPILGAKGDKGAKTPDRKCLPFICWYAAAGIACTTKYVKRSTKIRYLWG